MGYYSDSLLETVVNKIRGNSDDKLITTIFKLKILVQLTNFKDTKIVKANTQKINALYNKLM